MKPITEDHIEYFAIEQLQALEWEYARGLALILNTDVHSGKL